MKLRGALALLAAALLAGPASAQTTGGAAVEGAAESGAAAVAPLQATLPVRTVLPSISAAPLPLSAPAASLPVAPRAAVSVLAAPSAPEALAAPLRAFADAPAPETPAAAKADAPAKAKRPGALSQLHGLDLTGWTGRVEESPLPPALKRYWDHPDADLVAGKVAAGEVVSLAKTPFRLQARVSQEDGVLTVIVTTLANKERVHGPAFLPVTVLGGRGKGVDATLAKAAAGILKGAIDRARRDPSIRTLRLQAPSLMNEGLAESLREAGFTNGQVAPGYRKTGQFVLGKHQFLELSIPLPQDASAFASAASPRGPPSKRRGSRQDAVLDALNPFALLNNKVLGTAHDRVVPESFFTAPAKGAVVGINAVAGDEMYRRASNYMTGEGRDGVVLGHASSPESLVAALMSVYREHGPIERLAIAAHGAPGSMSIGGTHITAAWARARRDLLASLPDDLFVPGALIALISCSTAAGFLWSPGSGRKALKKIFGPMLKQGGTIRASTRYVDPVLGRIPPEYTNWGERHARNLMAPILLVYEAVSWLFGDWTSKVRKVVEIRVP